MIAPLSHDRYRFVMRKGATHHLNQEVGDVYKLLKQGRVNLVGLGREVEDTLDHVSAKDDVAILHGMVFPLDVRNAESLVHKLVNSGVHNL